MKEGNKPYYQFEDDGVFKTLLPIFGIIVAIFVLSKLNIDFDVIKDNLVSVVIWILGIAVGIAVYFLPSFIAYNKAKYNKNAILILNIVAGWTFIGWVVALVWSVTKDQREISKDY